MILGLGGLVETDVDAVVSTHRCGGEYGSVGAVGLHGEVVMTDQKIAVTLGGTFPDRNARADGGGGVRRTAGRPGMRDDVISTGGN